MLIIDSHCHAGKGEGFTGPWDTSAPLNRFLAYSAAAGIQKTVLFAAFHTDYAVANAAVARIVASNRQQFFGYAFVNAATDKGRVFEMVRTAVEQYGFIGIKAHRHDARISREVCEAAKAFQIPVLYDVMGDITAVELFATAYPSVNFIIPHLGSFADDWRAQLSFVPMLERHANVYTDTSGVRRYDLLEMAVQRAGAHKILFGSDGPWLHPNVELEKIFSLQLPEAETQLILAGNFLSLTQPIRAAVSGEIKQEWKSNNRITERNKGIDNPHGSKTSDHKNVIRGAQPVKFWNRAEKHIGQTVEKDNKTRHITVVPSSSKGRRPDMYRSLNSGGMQRIEVTSRSKFSATMDEATLCKEITRTIQSKIQRGQITSKLTTFEGNALPKKGIIVIVIQKNNIPLTKLKNAAECALKNVKLIGRSDKRAYNLNVSIKYYDENTRKYGTLAKSKGENTFEIQY